MFPVRQQSETYDNSKPITREFFGITPWTVVTTLPNGSIIEADGKVGIGYG
jgi:hypothetical protein